jgi:hypothetical protein
MEGIERIENKLDKLIEGQTLANKILLTTEEVGQLFGISGHILRNARKVHHLKHVVIDNKKIMYRCEDLEELINKCTI